MSVTIKKNTIILNTNYIFILYTVALVKDVNFFKLILKDTWLKRQSGLIVII